jgi:hypothetical protein
VHLGAAPALERHQLVRIAEVLRLDPRHRRTLRLRSNANYAVARSPETVATTARSTSDAVTGHDTSRPSGDAPR